MHHPHEIVCSLTQLTTELAHGIRSHTENIDLARDAKELRLVKHCLCVHSYVCMCGCACVHLCVY